MNVCEEGRRFRSRHLSFSFEPDDVLASIEPMGTRTLILDGHFFFALTCVDRSNRLRK